MLQTNTLSSTSSINGPINQLHPTEERWFAVYVSYKREKRVAERLHRQGIECYLPLKNVTRRYSRKVRHLELPLINCYLFVKIVKGEYVPVLQDTDVQRFLRIGKDLLYIPDEQMDLMRRVVGSQMDVAFESTPFRKGDLVEIIGGELTGIRGRLLEIEGKKRVLIQLDNFDYDLSISVEPQRLRRLDR